MGVIYSLLLALIVLSAGKDPTRSNGHTAVPAVSTIDLAGLRSMISERHGRPLLLNVWATWCIPCREEFPDLVRLRSAYPDSAVDMVAISVDYPDEVDSKIRPFLSHLRVPFPVCVSGVKKQEDFMNALDSLWNGGVPATFIYDGNGHRRTFLFGQKSYSVFKSELDSIMTIR